MQDLVKQVLPPTCGVANFFGGGPPGVSNPNGRLLEKLQPLKFATVFLFGLI